MKQRLDLAVTDLGPTQLKNIAEPIRVYSVEVGKPAQVRATKPAAPKQRSIFVLLAAGLVALAVIAAGVWLAVKPARGPEVSATTPRLSIVVLPFANLSGDPGQDYLADVLTEGLTTGLSRISGTFVIALSGPPLPGARAQCGEGCALARGRLRTHSSECCRMGARRPRGDGREAPAST